MSSLTFRCFKQRLAQVGTCLVTGLSYRSSSFSPQQYYINLYRPCSIKELHRSAAPLFSTAVVRQKKFKGPEEEYRELVDEASGINSAMEGLKNTSSDSVITVPVHLEKRLERRMRKESTKLAIRQKFIDISRRGNKYQVVIRCKRKEFNHYYGQSYESGAEVPLASAKWRHRKSAGDFFTLFPKAKRGTPFHMEGSETLTFEELKICPSLCDNLANLGIKNPTHIQVFAIPQLLKGGYNVVAAETGCGKTLAYLLPVIHQTLQDKRFKIRQKPGHPSSVILLPSRELADQVYSVAKRLTHKLDVSVKLLQGGNLHSKLINPPQSSTVDILIATTNALQVLTAAGAYGTGKILHVVLDEADTLMDDSFFPELVGPFLNKLPWDDLQRQIQLTLVSATMPKGIKRLLGEILKVDNFYFCTTPGLHYTQSHVPQTFLRLRKSQKPEKIKELVREDSENNVPVLIFCNKSKTCDWLSHYLNDEGIECASVHGRMHPKYRRGRVDMYQRGEINVLISTDLASRGIDTVRKQHVINYEFPLHIADYIHRCGRTGRVGSTKGCRVTNLISRLGEVETVKQIEQSVRKEKPLPDVNANIKRLYQQQYGSFVEIQPIKDTICIDNGDTNTNSYDTDTAFTNDNASYP